MDKKMVQAAEWATLLDKKPVELKELLQRIDTQKEEITKLAESKCRKILKPHLEYSPEVYYYTNRRNAIQHLLKLKRCRGRTRSNIFRTARAAGIERPATLNVTELEQRLRVFKRRIMASEAISPLLCKEHLRRQLAIARSSGSQEDVKGVKNKNCIMREARGKVWVQIKHTTAAPSGKSVTRVERMVNGVKQEVCTDRQSCQQALMEELSTRFSLASSASICNGWLGEQLGYLTDTNTAQSILDGSFVAPDGMDEATLMLLQEIMGISQQVVEGSVVIKITPDDFKHYWKKVNEKMSSSQSTLNFGHYKAAATSDFLSWFHATHLTAISRSGTPPDRWSRGLTIMLEKIAGVALVNKLRTILLMEADFNFHNKLIFGKHMLQKARLHNLIPDEQYAIQ